MIKKLKHFFVLISLISTLSSVSAADVVVLMDASGTILPWFDQINNRILVDITKKFIRPGDTFHLISFNSRVNLEIVQPVKTEADVSRIVSRFMLLYPIGQNSDFLSGLQYTWQYAQTLDYTKQKIVIFISDGIFNPPPTSSFSNLTSDEVKEELTSYARKIRGAGWSIYYIKLPFPEGSNIVSLDGTLSVSNSGNVALKDSASTNVSNELQQKNTGTDSVQLQSSTTNDSSSKNTTNESQTTQPSYTDISGEFLNQLNIPGTELPIDNTPINFIDTVFAMPTVEFNNSLGKKGRTFVLPLKITNPTASQLHIELTGILSDGVNYLEKNSFVTIPAKKTRSLRSIISLPETIPEGKLLLPIELIFADSLRTNPQSTTLSFEVTGFSLFDFIRTSGAFVYTFLIIFVALIFVLFFFFLLWKHSSTSTKEAVSAVGKPIYSTSEKTVPVSSEAIAQSSESKKIFSTHQTHQTPKQAEKIRFDVSSDNSTQTKSTHTEIPPKFAFQFPHVSNNKHIDFSVSKETSTNELNSLATEAQNIKNDRFAVLSAAQLLSQRKQTHIKAANPDEHILIKKNRSTMFELDVRNQNTHIGKRNIHIMRPGTKLSIGGKSSSFLVFLVKFPYRIADIRYDGDTCSLAILKPQYFPYETENVINNCVNKEFTIVSDKNYEVKFSIKEYEDPVVTINNLLNSIKY